MDDNIPFESALSAFDSVEYTKNDRIHIIRKFSWDYQEALKFQKSSAEYVEQNPSEIVLIFCSHPTCFTMGRGLQKSKGKILGELVETDTQSVSLPFPLHQIKRGGGLTYHYPGQIIVYPILRLGGRNPSLSKLADILFEGAISVISELTGLCLEKSSGNLIGLWHQGKLGPAKVASFGIAIEKFITMHGFALNVEEGEVFEVLKGLYPCGIQGGAYQYLDALLPENLDKAELMSLFEKTILTRIV